MLYLTLRGTTCSIGTGQRSLEANVEKADGLGHDHAGSAAVRIAMVLAHAYDRVEIPPTKMVTTRVNLFRAILPSGKTITAEPPDDMPPGSPFGPGIVTLVTYFHGCQMVGYARLAEMVECLFGLKISQGAITNILSRAAADAPRRRTDQ
jgi:transposase